MQVFPKVLQRIPLLVQIETRRVLFHAGKFRIDDPHLRRLLRAMFDEFAAQHLHIRIGFLAKILGGAGKTSIRASYGMFYTAIEALTIGVMSANAPYGTTYTSPAPPLFSSPFITAAHGQNLGQAFPVTLAPLNSSASHPDTSIDWSQFEGISTLGVTAGASAPEALVDEVIEAFAGRFDITVSAQGAGRETIVFNLPRELRPASPAA